MQQKRLYRSMNNRAVAGVAAGLADYLNIDPTLVRIGFVLLGLMTAVVPVFLIYLVLAVMMPQGYTSGPSQQPQQPYQQQPQQPYQQQPQQPYQQQPEMGQQMGSVFSEVGRRLSEAFSDIANSLRGQGNQNHPPQQPQQPPVQQAGYRAPQSNYTGNPQLTNMGQGGQNNLPPAPAPYMQPGYQGNPNLTSMGGSSGPANTPNPMPNGTPGNGGGYNNGGGNQMNSATMPHAGSNMLGNILMVIALLIFVPLAFGLGAGLFHFFSHLIFGRGLIGLVILGLIVWAIAGNMRRR